MTFYCPDYTNIGQSWYMLIFIFSEAECQKLFYSYYLKDIAYGTKPSIFL